VSTLFDRDGTVKVDAQKCPHLYRALVRGRAMVRDDWKRVVELRQAGQADEADRLVRRLLGVQGPPMSEEKKAELRAWKEEHKDEIKEREKQKREVRQRTVALLKTRRSRA